MAKTEESKKDSQVVNNQNHVTPNGLVAADDDMDPVLCIPRRKVKFWVYKNILLISLSFLMVFNAFQGLSRLQSSLHNAPGLEGLGVITSSLIYGSLVVSCMFVPKPLISVLGHKWTIPLSFIGYILYMAANGYARWGTMIPGAILVGLCAAPLWTAQCSYFTIVADYYARVTGKVSETVITRVFGIFFMFFQMSSITGSIISSTVLLPRAENDSTIVQPSEEQLKLCGANDCPYYDKSNNTNLAKPPESTVWTMVGIYMGIAVLAALLVCLLVDKLPKALEGQESSGCKEVWRLTLATGKHLRHKEMLLLIPITMYSGFEQASYNAEWTQSFISCSIGLWSIGFVTLPYGIVNAFVSFTSGRVVKYTGRLPVFLAGMVVDLAIQITLQVWIPHPDTAYALYILSGLWGFTDGIWQTQINALYGCIFSKESEAAFSNYRMWESIGFIIPFAYSNFICTRVKLAVLTSVLVLGMCGYIIVEWIQKKKRQEARQAEELHNGEINFAYEQHEKVRPEDIAAEVTRL